MSTLLGGSTQPPPGYPSYSETTIPKIFGTLTPLFALSLAFYSARVYSRVRFHGSLGIDDYAISAAVVLTIINYAVLVAAIVSTGGRHTFYVTPSELQNGLRLSFWTMPLWIWSVTMTKVSVLLMLLRIKRTANWKVIVWGMVGFVIATGVAITICQLLQCRPVKANWDLSTPRDHCWSPEKILNITYVVSSFFILADVACALLPLVFIRMINRPLREKVVLAVLMALGLIASACGIAKIALLKSVMYSQDPAFDGVNLNIWSYAEEYVGIIATCIPTLRRLLEKLFRALGGHISTSATKNNTDNHFSMHGSLANGVRQTMKSLRNSRVMASQHATTIKEEDASSDNERVLIHTSISTKSESAVATGSESEVGTAWYPK